MATQTTTPTNVRVNPTPAQTWNRLGINDYAFELPELDGGSGAAAHDFADIELAVGEAGQSWLDAAATHTAIEVEPHTMQTIVIEVHEAGDVAATEIKVGAGATAHIVCIGEVAAGLAGSILRVDAAEGATVELSEVVACSAEARFLDASGLRLGAGAAATLRQYMLGGGQIALSVCVDERGDQAAYEQTSRYLVQGGEQLDMNYVARMRGAKSTATMNFSGVLEQGARKRLADVIDLAHGAKEAEGHENETVLIAGDTVENLALPSVLCNEDDVVGTHGATIGSISPEQLSYLSDHGLSEDDIHALFVRALFDDAYQAIPEARATILAAAERTLGVEVAHELANDIEHI